MSHVKRSILTGAILLAIGVFALPFGPGASADEPSVAPASVVSVQDAPLPDAAVVAMLFISAG